MGDDKYYNKYKYYGDDGGGGDDGDDGDDGTDEGSLWAGSEEGINSYFVAFLSLLALNLILAKYLHESPRLSSILPEAGMTIIVGVITGSIISHSNKDGVAQGLLSFSPKVFFYVLLPPIIFSSGYNLKRQVFFRLIGPISIFACVGTTISTVVVAFMLEFMKEFGLTGEFKPHFTELLTFGALISATDPVSTLAVFQAKKVDPQLFYLVFGESVLNDAVGLVMFKSLSKFVGDEDAGGSKAFQAFIQFMVDFSISFAGSMALGFLAGLICAFFFKKVEMRNTPLLELSLFLLIMYLPFFAAELIELSGIVTILFTGIFAKRYVTENLSEYTEENVDVLFRVSAHLAETSIFLELGLSVYGISYIGGSEWQFACWAIIACLVGRAMHVYPIVSIYNSWLADEDKSKREPAESIDSEDSSVDLHRSPTNTPKKFKDLKIHENTAHMLWFSGLRGAVAYACAKEFPNAYGNRTFFVFTTMAVVLFTVFSFGCTTGAALNTLGIETDVDEDEYMKKNDTEMKMNFLNKFEHAYLYPHVRRDHKQQYGLDTIEERSGSFDSDGNSQKSSRFQLYDYGESASTAPERTPRRQSLYDFGVSATTDLSSCRSTTSSQRSFNSMKRRLAEDVYDDSDGSTLGVVLGKR